MVLNVFMFLEIQDHELVLLRYNGKGPFILSVGANAVMSPVILF